jgi:glutamate transport system permease protein
MDVVSDNLGSFTSGWLTTVQLAVLSFLFAMTIGLLIAAMRVSPFAPARGVGTAYVDVFRNSPLPVLMVLFWFGFPKVDVNNVSRFLCAVLVLSLYTGSFIGETVRAGINSVAVGQSEAARSIGLTFLQNLRLVILPQALRTVVQPIGNIWIALVKNTSAAYLIGNTELIYRTEQINTANSRPIPIFLAAAAGYLLLTLPSGAVLSAIERRVAIKR